MTCAEFQHAVLNSNPSVVTIGEAAAVLRHPRICRSCMLWIEAGMKIVLARGVDPVAEQKARELACRIADDPEAVETIFG